MTSSYFSPSLSNSGFLGIECSVQFHNPVLPQTDISRCYISGSHSLRLLCTQWIFCHSISIYWTCSVLLLIKMKYRRRCGSLGMVVPNMRRQPMCIVGWCCLSPSLSYHWLSVSGTASHASTSICLHQFSWWTWCTGIISLVQCQVSPFPHP